MAAHVAAVVNGHKRNRCGKHLSLSVQLHIAGDQRSAELGGATTVANCGLAKFVSPAYRRVLNVI